ncbi:MAG: cysteine--tRNA ligase, partial [Desulfobacterales bacterium]
PRVMAVVQELLKSSLSDAEKLAGVLDFDRVLGVGLASLDQDDALPEALRKLVDQREAARAARNWALSDQLRDEIQAMGYLVQDSRDGMKVIKP